MVISVVGLILVCAFIITIVGAVKPGVPLWPAVLLTIIALMLQVGFARG